MLLPIVTLAWLLGGLWRIYRHAQYFQIEEYKNDRYWRWLRRHPERWPWRRAATAYAAGVVLGFVMSESPDALLITAIYTAAALIAVWPPRRGEVKKPFRATQRALRLLVAAFALFSILALAAFLLLNALQLDLRPLQYALAGGAGLALYLVAPLFLMAGNLAVYPVEELLRRGFERKARSTLTRLRPKVIGITGSFGKTSTKHFLHHMLSVRYDVVATPKSYNTLMGVCLTVNNQLAGTRRLDYFVVEMGAYVPGEIARICQLTQPQISIVTAVGPQHLERFGSIANIVKAKSEIVEALPPDGVAVLNGDDDHVRTMVAKAPGKVVIVSRSTAPQTGARLVAKNIREGLDGLDFDVVDTVTGAERHFHAPLWGEHNVTNILLATAAAQQLGLSLAEIAMRVATLEPFEHRLERKVQPGGLTVLDDAYSANPVGARSALRVLGMHTRGKRILITPGMVELGDLHAEENRKLGALAADYCTDIVLVGREQTRPIYEGVTSTAFDEDRLFVCDAHSEAVAWLRNHAAAGDTVLFLNDLPDTYL